MNQLKPTTGKNMAQIELETKSGFIKVREQNELIIVDHAFGTSFAPIELVALMHGKSDSPEKPDINTLILGTNSYFELTPKGLAKMARFLEVKIH